MSIRLEPSRFLRLGLVATAISAALAAAPAQAELDSVEIIAAAGPGGGYDQLARSR